MTANLAKLLITTQRRLLSPVFCACQSVRYAQFECQNRKLYSTKRLLDKEVEERDENEGKSEELKGAIDRKYRIFRDEDSEVIFDVAEEMQRMNLQQLEKENFRDPYEGLNMTRGKTGVFDIEDLIEVLKRDNAERIFVAKVPKEWAYVDYIVVVTAKSVRHMKALMQFVRKAYKIKRHETDLIPVTEGKTSSEWQAIDLGNIALHIFRKEFRERFDLETLWAVGSKYDDLTNKMDKDADDLMESYNSFLSEFEPIDSETQPFEPIESKKQ